MSCQSLAARAFAEPEKDTITPCTGFHRTVRFSSESRSSTRASGDADSKRDAPASISLSALTMTPVTSHSSAMSQSAPPTSATFDLPETPEPSARCRFPKLEECAHFHYERVCLGGLAIELVPWDDHCEPEEGWICLKVRSHVNSSLEEQEVRTLSGSWTDASDVCEWTLTRNREHLLQLDEMLHRCIYDRGVSGLPKLRTEMPPGSETGAYRRLVADYVHHLSMIADDTLNCGPVLSWLQADNRGHKLLVANEDSSSINTPAVAAAYSVRKYVSQARDEISFEVGDMISIIDMPGPQESVWWRGKRGFRVGFFPRHCVAVIGDKVPRHMTQPPPIVGSVAVAPIKPVLRKHGKLISLFRSFILSRPSRRRLKQQGILRERVFGCDLGEHLLNCGHDVPAVLVACAEAIEARGPVDGIYRLSGGSGLTQRLRAAFDAGARPALALGPVARDPHAVPSLLKMYFRELPNPLCTYQLYDSFVQAVQLTDDASKLRAVRETVVKLPPPHYRTLAYLMRHLRRVSLLGSSTGMTARNMAIVWAPNLLRGPLTQHALQGVAVQAVVTEFLICYAEDLFSQEQGADISESGPSSLEIERIEHNDVELRGIECSRRPKSLPLTPPTKLLSLEEARRRGRASANGPSLQPVPTSNIASGSSPNTNTVQLRPEAHLRPKYIEVGSGPNNLPQYHTVLELPAPGKRGIKRSPSGWRGLFSRTKQKPPPPTPPEPETAALPLIAGLRPVKSCESLTSDDTLGPEICKVDAPRNHHARSSSCDSYFEPWQAELAGMRLRLSPQERDLHMFSEEDNNAQEGSANSTPAGSLCSAEPSPRRQLKVDIEAANDAGDKRRWCLEEQLSQIGYIDGESPRLRHNAEKRHQEPPPSKHCATDQPKRLCKDRDSPMSSLSDLPTPLTSVKMRERNSPRKTKASARYSGLHHPLNLEEKNNTRLSWHGKDGHSTLIKIDWPLENSSVSNLTASTLNSTPITPVYDPLESDSEVSERENNKQTIKIENSCENCEQEKCLKCELKATDYNNERKDSLDPSPIHSVDISYQNLNRLSAVSTSSNSESDRKRQYENCDVMRVMTSSHESSSSYSNASLTKQSDDYESYNFSRPNYINLQSSSTSKSSPGSPLKSPLKSTISITFRSPVKNKSQDYETIDNLETPTNERDSVYEDIDLDKNLSIVEEATVPEGDASLPTQQACQPEFNDLIILETPVEDVYSQVKFFKQSIKEVNAMILESPPEKERHYENVDFEEKKYENVDVDVLKISDKDFDTFDGKDAVMSHLEKDNGNTIKVTNLNVRELANRFESPTEQKGPFTFEKFKAEIKYPSLERKDEDRKLSVEARKKDLAIKLPPPVSPKTYKLSKHSCNARSLDENAFIKEFGDDKANIDRRKSLEVKSCNKQTRNLPDLNLNIEENVKVESVTPTTENKISLIQRFDQKPDVKTLINFDTEKKLSRERIEKYKEERRNFLREKYSSQSFRSNPEQLTRIKIKKDQDKTDTSCDRLKEETPKFERRNTVDLGQRMRFSLAKSANNLDTIQSPSSPDKTREFAKLDGEPSRRDSAGRKHFERKEKMSPSYNIKDMAALFEQKSNGTNG